MAFSATQRKCHILVVFLLYALFFLPLWVALPALNEYVIARRCQSMHGIFNNTGPVCGAPDVSESGQEWNTWIMLSCNLPSVLVVLPLGRLMDVRGRRPVLLWCLATQVAGSAGMLCVCLLDLDLEWFFPGYLVNGFGGGSYALQSILMASLTDVASSKKQRGLLLACATASYYACGCVGPLLGGFVSGSSTGNSTSSSLELFPKLGGHQYQFAYLLFFSTNTLLLLVAAIFWRETLQSEANAVERLDVEGGGADSKNGGHGSDGRCCSPKKSSWLKAFILSFAGAVKVLKGRAIIVVALVFMLLYSTINVALSGLTITFAKLDRFDMDDETVGWFLAVPWFVRATAASILFPALLQCTTAARCCRAKKGNQCCCQAHQGQTVDLEAELLEPTGSTNMSKADALVLATSLETSMASLWILRAGTVISVTVFACFGLATSTPILFVLCGVEGLAAVWDAACAVLFSTLADAAAVRRKVAQSTEPNASDAGDLSGDNGSNLQTQAESTDQGAVLGLRALLQTTMACVGPFVFTEIYVSTVQWDEVFVFYVLGGCCALALGLSFLFRAKDVVDVV